MKAAVMVAESEPLELRELPCPEPGPGEAVIEVAITGVCGTDAHLWDGHWRSGGIAPALPRVLGHELAGTISAAGVGVHAVAVGDRVTLPFHLACGSCPRCLSGLGNLCARAEYLGSSVDGGFAEYVKVPQANLNCVPLPDNVGFEAGAMLGCRYMTAFRGLVDLARVEPGEHVAIIGSEGGLGAAALQLVQAVGALPVRIDLGERLAGIDSPAAPAFAAQRKDLVASVVDATAEGPSVVFNATGAPDSVVSGLRMLRPRGRLVQAGLTTAAEAGIVPAAIDTLTQKELQVMGVSGNPHVRYAPLLGLLNAGLCHPEELITHRIGLEGTALTDALRDLNRHRADGVVAVTPGARA